MPKPPVPIDKVHPSPFVKISLSHNSICGISQGGVNALQTLKMGCLLGAALLQAVTSRAQPVTKIAAGAYHSLFLKSDGSLWAMGNNRYGQLGDGTYGVPPYNGTNRPEQIVASNVTAIAAGDCPQPVSQERRQPVGHGRND